MDKNSTRFRQNWPDELTQKLSDGSALHRLLAMTVSALVIVCACLLFQRYMHRDFLGERTQLIHKCKENPDFNPQKCAQLLSVRGVGSTSSTRSFSHPALQKGFQLSPSDDYLHERRRP
jgi:hypothetical protein